MDQGSRPLGMVSIERDPSFPRREKLRVLSATLLWRGALLSARHVRARREIRVRDLAFGLDADVEDLIVARIDASEGLVLVLPNGACVPSGSRLKLNVGGAMILLALEADDVAPLPPVPLALRQWKGVGVSAILHVAAVALMLLARTLPTTDASTSFYIAKALLEPRVEETASPATIPTVEETAPSPRTVDGTQAPERRTRAERSAEVVASFGMIAVVEENARTSRASRFAKETRDAKALFGDYVADARGAAAIDLSGTGESGGGLGAGIPLDRIGTVGGAGAYKPAL